jgi:hypothetical protein
MRPRIPIVIWIIEIVRIVIVRAQAEMEIKGVVTVFPMPAAVVVGLLTVPVTVPIMLWPLMPVDVVSGIQVRLAVFLISVLTTVRAISMLTILVPVHEEIALTIRTHKDQRCQYPLVLGDHD